MLPSTACPVCDGHDTREFLRREGVPVHQNLLFATRREARSITRGDLAMRVCGDCSFVFNAAFNPDLLSYGESYDNTQTHSPMFQRYVAGLVTRLVEERGIRNCDVVEVGCGKGGFLQALADYPDSGIRGFGYDPTYEGPATKAQGRLQFERRFYDASCAAQPADAVVCRHVIEHVPRPLDLIGAVRQALGAATAARVFFETPCVDWIIRHEVLWDFFYEHCSLFTPYSLATAFQRSGFTDAQVSHVFAGQYLWLEAQASDVSTSLVTNIAINSQCVSAALQYGATVASWQQHWQQELRRLATAGGVALWGAGAKGVTFANLCDVDAQTIQYVVDINPNKQNRFLAGTGHEIVAPTHLTQRKPAAILVLNPNYVAEIQAELDKHNVQIPVWDVMSMVSSGNNLPAQRPAAA